MPFFYGWVAGSNTWAPWGLRDIAETHIKRVKIIEGVGFIRFGGTQPEIWPPADNVAPHTGRWPGGVRIICV